MYRVETEVRGHPYAVEAADEERARQQIRNCYAAWGQPVPATLSDEQAATFKAQLAQTGSYAHAEGEASARVTRISARP